MFDGQGSVPRDLWRYSLSLIKINLDSFAFAVVRVQTCCKRHNGSARSLKDTAGYLDPRKGRLSVGRSRTRIPEDTNGFGLITRRSRVQIPPPLLERSRHPPGSVTYLSFLVAQWLGRLGLCENNLVRPLSQLGEKTSGPKP